MAESSASDVKSLPLAPLCGVCKEFIDTIASWDFKQPSEEARLLRAGPDSRWGEYGWRFHHYGSSEEITKSAEFCSLCRLILDCFEPDKTRTMSELTLDPWYGQNGGYPATPGIQAGFLDENSRWSYGLLRTSWLRPYLHAVEEGDNYSYNRLYERDVPDSAASQDCLDTIRYWLKDCSERHPKCRAATRSSALPTRVIDIGNLPDDTPILYISHGEKAPYATLSHCWGGHVPLGTTTETLAAHQDGLSADRMPQNFQDAIRVTRLAGLRYLWIDSLCIIQDDPKDWAAEAEHMTAIYRNSTLTISALDSKGPDTGFLVPRTKKSLTISPKMAIHCFRQGFSDAMEDNILTKRGWCMQERLLSPVVLHFGRDQLYWECCSFTLEESRGCSTVNYESSPEDNSGGPAGVSCGLRSDGLRNYRIPAFTRARKKFHVSGPGSWSIAVEEYSHRNITFRRDKLVAIAGVAKLVRPAEAEYSYIAGHFMGGGYDILSSLFWSARVKLTNGKAPGFRDIEALTRPDDNYPSWSWASVDGGVEFHSRSGEDSGIELLGVEVDVGRDDFMAERVKARLKIRASIAKLRYTPCEAKEDREIVGTIWPVGHTAAMDVDRARDRNCWVLVNPSGGGVLVLDEVSIGVFRRVGWAEPQSLTDQDPKVEYCVKEFELI
ncbi:hypothetical protein GGTG_10189 [Gaeumannomyces tritici R3-111a-1]|uniref:Heterokaryon incompatibility domain-containing protein n=1 Tax=Gaeumannomyces tritici (strain R3-111a-1) TaxID=644352 RepID=J3P9K9_GAET3|nr:hypothetical protein GGTG_10189 [Gaeumannomyces tritici R3-111a-1]EJT73345.1 hypothetical protein GGTG_10189 [Gaeumannomyces tritici R3-111a-1]